MMQYICTIIIWLNAIFPVDLKWQPLKFYCIILLPIILIFYSAFVIFCWFTFLILFCIFSVLAWLLDEDDCAFITIITH